MGIALSHRKLVSKSSAPSLCAGLRSIPFLLALAFLSYPSRVDSQTTYQEELKLANEASNSKRFEEAISHYRRVFEDTASRAIPRSVLVEAQTGLASAYFMLHRYRESLDTLKPLIPSSEIASRKQIPSEAWLVQGLDYLELNQLADAIYSFRQCLARDPNSANARLALGDALARSDRLEEAAKEYEDQTRRTPSLADAWYKLGLAHSALADGLLGDSERKSSGNVVALQLVAEELLNKGSNLLAAKSLFHLLHDAASHAGAHADLGHALLELGYAKSAESQFHKELAVDPNSPLAQFDLAQIAALRGDWDEVSAELGKVSGLYPRAFRLLLEFPPAGLLRQAWIEKKTQIPTTFAGSSSGELWKAWLDGSEVTAAPAQKKTSASGSCLGNILSPPGAWLPEACYEVLRVRLRTQKALSAEEKAKLAETEFRLGHYQAALQAASLTLQADGDSDWGAYWLTKSQGALADECFARVAALNPDSPRVHQMLAKQYAVGLEYAKAKAEYEAAIRLAPDLADLHLGLGTMYWRTDDWPQAEKEFLKALDLAPASAMARYRLGNTYVQESRWDDAIEQLRRVANDASVSVSARLDLAKAESELGQTREAIRDLLPLVAQDSDGEVHFRLAALYRKVGDGTRAQEALEVFRKLRAAALQADKDELDELDREQGADRDRDAPNSD